MRDDIFRRSVLHTPGVSGLRGPTQYVAGVTEPLIQNVTEAVCISEENIRVPGYALLPCPAISGDFLKKM